MRYRGSFPGNAGCFSSPQHPNRLWGSPSLIFILILTVQVLILNNPLFYVPLFVNTQTESINSIQRVVLLDMASSTWGDKISLSSQSYPNNSYEIQLSYRTKVIFMKIQSTLFRKMQVCLEQQTLGLKIGEWFSLVGLQPSPSFLYKSCLQVAYVNLRKACIFIQIRTERNAIAAIAVTWVLILLVSVPVYLSHGEVKYTYSSSEHTACVFLEADPVNRPDGYHKLLFQVHRDILFCLLSQHAPPFTPVGHVE